MSSQVNALLNVAVSTLPLLNSGEVFTVKDLFKGFEWNRIQIGERTKLGSAFFTYANSTGLNIIKPLGKTPQNQQKYQIL